MTDHKREVKYLVEKLDLKKLWTDDYLSQFYWSSYGVSSGDLPDQFHCEYKLCNWAYYLLPSTTVCPFHMLNADESWQFCAGGPLELFIIHGLDEVEKVIVGPDFMRDHSFIHIVPGGKWFAARCAEDSPYTLITHCVFPSFDKRDEFEGYYEDMIKLIPSYPGLVKQLSWPRSVGREN